MVLERLIKELCISSDYRPFVDSFINRIIICFSERIHSIYICGSIPKGTAVPNISDADFTIVFRNETTEADEIALENLKSGILADYPFITKIDALICTVTEALNSPDDWGFWIKIVSIFLHGEKDLSSMIPPIVPDNKLVLGINSDTEKRLDDLITVIKQSPEFETPSHKYKKLTKKLLIALYTLILPKEQIWTDNVDMMKFSILKHYPEKRELLESLIVQSDAPCCSPDGYLSKAEEAREWFFDELLQIKYQ